MTYFSSSCSSFLTLAGAWRLRLKEERERKRKGGGGGGGRERMIEKERGRGERKREEREKEEEGKEGWREKEREDESEEKEGKERNREIIYDQSSPLTHARLCPRWYSSDPWPLFVILWFGSLGGGEGGEGEDECLLLWHLEAGGGGPIGDSPSQGSGFNCQQLPAFICSPIE